MRVLTLEDYCPSRLFCHFFRAFQAALLLGDLLALLDSSVRRIQDFLLQEKLNIIDEYFIQ